MLPQNILDTLYVLSSYLCIQNVQEVCRGTPTLSQSVKEVMVLGLKLLGEKARCSGAVSLCETEGCAAMGSEAGPDCKLI